MRYSVCHNHCQQQLLNSLFNLVSSSTFHNVLVVNSLGVFSLYCQSYSDGSISVSQITGMVSVHCERNRLSTLCAETVSKVLFTNSSFHFIFLMALPTHHSVCVCVQLITTSNWIVSNTLPTTAFNFSNLVSSSTCHSVCIKVWVLSVSSISHTVMVPCQSCWNGFGSLKVTGFLLCLLRLHQQGVVCQQQFSYLIFLIWHLCPPVWVCMLHSSNHEG